MPTPAQQIDPAIKQWATDRQCEYIDAVIEHGSNRKAALALGVHRSVIDMALRRPDGRFVLSGIRGDVILEDEADLNAHLQWRDSIVPECEP